MHARAVHAHAADLCKCMLIASHAHCFAGMGMDDLRQSTKLRTARSWSWEERTPGTVGGAKAMAMAIAMA